MKFIGWLPFSLGGAVFLVLSWIALQWFGIDRSDLVMVVVGGVGLALCVLGLFLTLFSGIYIYWKLKSTERKLALVAMVDQSIKTEFQLRLPWWLPLIQIKWGWKNSNFYITQEGGIEKMVPLRRGEWEKIEREFFVGDAFGICQIRFVLPQQCTISIVPNTKDLMVPQIVEGLQGGADIEHPFGKPQGDRLDIRNYAQGDPVRYILWKVYARTGELVVRTPERAYQPTKKMMAYLIVSTEDKVASGLAVVTLESEILGKEWVFGVDGYQGVISQKEPAYQAILSSGQSEIEQGSGLSDFVRAARDDSSSLLVFAPPKKGAWVQEVLQISQTLPVSIIIGAKELREQGFWSSWKDVLLLPDEIEKKAIVSSAEIDEILAEFVHTKVNIAIVNQQRKMVLSAEQYQGMTS